MTTATYAKLNDGSWGVRVNGTIAAGARVTVSKRDGSSKHETVARVIWSGIAKDGRQASLVEIAAGRRACRGVWNGCSCGAREMSDGSLSSNACATCRYDNE